MDIKSRLNLYAALIMIVSTSFCVQASQLAPMITYQLFTKAELLYRQPIPRDEYGVPTIPNQLYIVRVDYSSGTRGIVDSIEIGWDDYIRSIETMNYDPVHGRIFFEGNLLSSPHQVNVLDLNARTISKLPFLNYSGDPADYILSHSSRYVLFGIRSAPSDWPNWSIEQYSVLVLDGDTLKEISRRQGILIKTDIYDPLTFPSSDNLNIFNMEYQTETKIYKIIRYAMPELMPVDTIFIDDIGWHGYKGIRDISGNSLLISGYNPDNSSGLEEGEYAFLLDGLSGKIISPMIPIANVNYTRIFLTPEADEIIAVEDKGLISRYSTVSGEKISEIQGPVRNYGPVLRTDGNLYIDNVETHETMVIDYKTNLTIRTFELDPIGE